MKKTYMKPEMEAYKMEAINMVCESPGLKGDKPAVPGGSLAPQMPDFFEEDDIISWEE